MSTRSSRRSGKGSGGKSGKRSKRDVPQSVHLYIAVYDPSEGFYHHWAMAIYNEATNEWHTYDAVRSYAGGPFMSHYLAVDPRNSARCRDPLVYVATCPSTSIDNIHGTIQGVEMQPDENWNCQNYVFDIINALIRNNLVTQAEYNAAWNQVSPYYGPMQQAFDAQQPAADDQRILSEEYVFDSDDDDEGESANAGESAY